MTKINIRVVITGVLLITMGMSVQAQQEPQFTQNMFTNMAINPGYAGLNRKICATTLFRQQWSGFTDPDGNHSAPQTILFTVDAPIRPIKGGAGLVIFKDKLGFEDNIAVKISYSYHLRIQNAILGIGAQIGFLNKKINFAGFRPNDESDPLLMNRSLQSTMATDLTFGAFYTLPGKYFAGISSSQLIQSKLNIPGLQDSKLKRHYYIVGGYHYVLPSAPDFELSPYILIKTDFASTQYDITGMCKWKEMAWAGLTYRHQDAISIILGGKPLKNTTFKPEYNDLKIGYSYDITTSALGSKGRSSGTHEIMLGYCFTIIKNPSITRSKTVRFM